MGTELGVADAAIVEALGAFTGVGRRFAHHGDLPVPDGGHYTLIDDYGHHPVEMAATLEAARGAFPGRRLVLAFQPHRYTRTRDCFEDFVKVLSTSDALLLAEVYPAGEAPIVAADGRSLARALRVAGKVEPIFAETIDELTDGAAGRRAGRRRGDHDGRGLDRAGARTACRRRGGMTDATSLGKVGVLFGGRSSEREVSIMSGTGVLNALRSRGVDAHAFDPGRQTLAELEAARFDRVFIALHGRGGEDGTIQGVLETLRVPYTGQRGAGLGDRDRQGNDQARSGSRRAFRRRLTGSVTPIPTGCRWSPSSVTADRQTRARGLDHRHHQGDESRPQRACAGVRDRCALRRHAC